MAPSAQWYHTQRLRIAAGASLATAVTMSALGLTAMEPHLDVKGASFWIWWGIVLLLTVVALSMAVFDMADLNRQLRAQKRELMREHFDKTFLSQLEREIGDSQKAPKGAATHAQGENHSRR